MNAARFGEILRLLAENDVEFIVVGMTAGVLGTIDDDLGSAGGRPTPILDS
jgi:hypothetical protein